MPIGPFVRPPRPLPWSLRPLLAVSARVAGSELLPARLLAHVPRLALALGLVEALAPAGPRDLDARSLAIARIVASATAGCPFCLDMNAATWKRAGLSADEVTMLVALDEARWIALAPRERLVARYASALSQTPVSLSEDLLTELECELDDHEIVVLAVTIGLVNFWSRFNQGVGVPAAGLAAASGCPVAMPSA